MGILRPMPKARLVTFSPGAACSRLYSLRSTRRCTQRTGAPLINVHCEPLPGGRYRVVFHPRIEFPAGASLQEMAQACWDQFEPVVRKNPAPWLWMYKHFRYRPLAANLAAYPFYANISEDFERRLDEGARKLPPMTSKVKLPMAVGESKK